jgi:hypothetical protein
MDIDIGQMFYPVQQAVCFIEPVVPYYGTLTGATTYFKTRLRSESWENADSEDRLKALYEATRRIEVLSFKGIKQGTLFFPRTIDSRVPADIEIAAYEIALALLDGIDPEIEARNLSVAQTGYAGVVTKYDRDFTQAHIRAGIPSALAWDYLRPYLCDPESLILRRGS